MDTSVTTPEILTFGRFSISVAGKRVAINWPDETLKVFFCSLLSPLDLFFSWDRLSRAMWDEPASITSRQRMDERYTRPLKSFLIRELGFNPLITGSEGIHINQQMIHVDAFEFYSTLLAGLRLLSLDDDDAAHEKFSRADTLYTGIYLPGISGKIIDH
ncbi:MAG: hypothetical protein M0T70_17865, partial [Geobacteraceae bacterium]|nr:hypothetical protein [Geobacteraceae bacterium]